MTFTYLRDQKHYEDLYDHGTVETCRSGERVVNDSFREVAKKAGPKELEERKPGWYLFYSQTYFGLVESPAASRAVKRDQTIKEWMERDAEKDRRLADAYIDGGMYCRSCGKDMRVLSKDYMRQEGRTEDDILLMFECDNCNKRQAYWQDGTEWEGARVKCYKCGGDMTSTHKREGKVITTTMTCNKTAMSRRVYWI